MPKRKTTSPPIPPTDQPPVSRPKRAIVPYAIKPSEKGLGAMTYSDREMGELFAQSIVKKGEYGRNKWADTALVLVSRAKKASQTYSKKDFNALYRLVLSAGIAFDKAWPTTVAPLSGNLVVQLFGSLGSEVAKAILEPPRPTIIDVTPSLPNNTPSDGVVDNPTPLAADPQVIPSDEPLDDTK